eukprot:Nk52_evm29s343 gene=Nk52_evmTU29s343
MGNEIGKQSAGSENDPTHVQKMGKNLQRKFAYGVQYNMKVVIKGDRNTGKSCLMSRLKGGRFIEEYVPTQEIDVANIHWNHKGTNDIVKVEVWDVVDKGRTTRPKNTLKLSNETDVNPVLDAEFVDVYKNAHGVLMVMDITKKWTMDYCVREVEKVPADLPVLVLCNFRDLGAERVVKEEDLVYWVDTCGRKDIHWIETSMVNGFGLRYIYKFFDLPFLKLQKETLQRQLEINERDLATTFEELSIMASSELQSYDKFCEYLEARARGVTSTDSAEDKEKDNSSGDASKAEVSEKNEDEPKKEMAGWQEIASQPSKPTLFRQRSSFSSSSKGEKATPVDGSKAVGDFVPDSEGIDGFLDDDGDGDADNARGELDFGNSDSGEDEDEEHRPAIMLDDEDLSSGSEAELGAGTQSLVKEKEKEKEKKSEKKPQRPTQAERSLSKKSSDLSSFYDNAEWSNVSNTSHQKPQEDQDVLYDNPVGSSGFGGVTNSSLYEEPSTSSEPYETMGDYHTNGGVYSADLNAEQNQDNGDYLDLSSDPTMSRGYANFSFEDHYGDKANPTREGMANYNKKLDKMVKKDKKKKKSKSGDRERSSDKDDSSATGSETKHKKKHRHKHKHSRKVDEGE